MTAAAKLLPYEHMPCIAHMLQRSINTQRSKHHGASSTASGPGTAAGATDPRRANAVEFHAGNDQAPEPQSSSNKSNPGPTTPQTGYADSTRMGQTADTEHSPRALQTTDDDDEDVKVVGEISSAVSTTAPTSMPIPTTSIQSCSPTPTTSFEDEGQCPICLDIFTQRELPMHASVCGDSVLQTLDYESSPPCGTPVQQNQGPDMECPDDVLSLMASRVDDCKDFKICVSRTDFYQRAMLQWQRQKRGSPANTLRVTFLGEAGVDTGAIRKEFLTDLIGEIEKHLFEHRGHQREKSPIYSLSNLEKGFFRTAGEVFSVSLAFS
ncbi:uncharacterized protein LOC130558390 [Triplophysa rosa]|uniref:uncharacterized protein LOC130558390 n=1 Tax=Triplophysa rosa TaxID=992332 RepID=UPI0025460ECD|nr:uncharacterized protein LOC130558390 [Triplophysa rosa]